MIEVEHVSRSFGSFRAVDDVSFSIKTGEIVGLLGPNGAGKTTTMRMITGFLPVSSGTIKIDGQNITEDEKSAKKKIGYMPESAPLYGDMIVEDYLQYVAAMQNADAEEKVSQLCRICGLTEVMHKNISELSRGYRQRVGLAHALMNDPEILILDEPTSGLDPNQIGEVRDLIKEIGKTRTVIISTHILSEVEMLCGRVIIISHGKIAADSPTSELRTRFGNTASIHIQAAGCTQNQLEKLLTSFDGVSSVRFIEDDSDALTIPSSVKKRCGAVVSVSGDNEIRPLIVSSIAEKGWTLYDIALQRNSLEDVFRTLTTGGVQ